MKVLRTTIILTLLFIAQSSHATMLFCDTFTSYTTANGGSLNYQIGGFGGKGYWGIFDYPEGWNPPDKGQWSFAINNSGLTGSLTTYPNRVILPSTSTHCEIQRNLGFTLGANGTTRYLRFLLRAEYPTGTLWPVGSYMGVELRSSTSSRVYVGKGSSSSFVMGSAAGYDVVTAPGTFVASTTYVMVLKMQFQAGNDILTMYINPGAGQEPASGTVRTDRDLGQMDTLALVCKLGMSVDDIVVADSYADVMNVSSLPTIPVITPDVATVTEGDAGTNAFTFTVRLSTPVSHQVSVDYKTVNASAIAGQDYVSKSGTLVFPPGTTVTTGTIGIIGDLVEETNQVLLLQLGWPISAQFTSGAYAVAAGITVVDNDVNPPKLSFSRSWGGQFGVSWNSWTNAYLLESATNIPSPVWTEVTDILQSQTTLTNISFGWSGPYTAGSRFYRLRKRF